MSWAKYAKSWDDPHCRTCLHMNEPNPDGSGRAGETTLTSEKREIWKIIPQWPDYEASSLGRIRRAGSPTVYKPSLNLRGYQQVSLRKNGHRSTVTVAKLIAETFIGPRPDGLDINHIDGVKTNNLPENLEYCTRSENIRHSFRLGLSKGGSAFGTRNGLSKLNETLVAQMRSEYAAGATFQTIGKRFGVHWQTARSAIRGFTWRQVGD